MEQRHAAVALRELRRKHGLELGIRALEVAGEGSGQAVLLTECARQRIEVDKTELDQVRAEASAPHDLCPQRLLHLVGFEHVRGDE